MRIGVLTEGASEVKCLNLLYDQVHSHTRHRLLAPLKINVNPKAPPGIIARECKSRLLIAKQKGAERSVVLLDREDSEDCPGKIALSIESAIMRLCPIMPVRAVLKNRTFENWLIADPEALAAHPKRFTVTAAVRRRIRPDRADSCAAYELLSSIAVRDYQKISDSRLICSGIDLSRAASNSRSLRHFLHVLDVTPYRGQCKKIQSSP